MNDVNSSILSKNAELVIETLNISSLARVGEMASLSDNKVDVDALSVLFAVIAEKLETLAMSIQQSNVKDSSNPSPFPQKNIIEQTFINREFGNSVIRQRGDGYIDATEMCKATGKKFAGYRRLDSTQAFIKALSTDVQIHTSELIQSLSGGNPEKQGTWVHPRVAIHLAQWCSPEFAVQVSSWVFELMTTGEVHLQSKPQQSKIHDFFPRTDAPIQSYIDECLERREAGEEIPQLNSQELIRKAIMEGCHTRREIADYTGIKIDTVKKMVQRMMKKGVLYCTSVKGQSRVFLNS